jgi:hypothetical protein
MLYLQLVLESIRKIIDEVYKHSKYKLNFEYADFFPLLLHTSVPLSFLITIGYSYFSQAYNLFGYQKQNHEKVCINPCYSFLIYV